MVTQQLHISLFLFLYIICLSHSRHGKQLANEAAGSCLSAVLVLLFSHVYVFLHNPQCTAQQITEASLAQMCAVYSGVGLRSRNFHVTNEPYQSSPVVHLLRAALVQVFWCVVVFTLTQINCTQDQSSFGPINHRSTPSSSLLELVLSS